LVVKEVEEKRPLSVAERVAREGELLLAQVPNGAALIVLDERGKTLESTKFAQRLAAWRDEGRSHLTFLIGGADGHSENIRNRADFLLSLGMMTWPHMLVRGMLVEQLYRAECILANHPYHRGRID
jgi:23S rRNA (pseudouridine1915-N3)-methyltransferase